MESIFAHCSAFFATTEGPLVVSVLIAGLVASLSHCSVMCGPVMAAQMLQTGGRARPWLRTLLYQLGRISTYAMLGVIVFFSAQWIFSGAMQEAGKIALLIAGVVFIVSALRPHNTHKNCQHKKASPALSHVQLYLRGALMGFMPCGLTLALLIMVATLPSVWHAASIMILFGIATSPALSAAAWGMLQLDRLYPKHKHAFARGMIGLNGLFLCAIGSNVISLS